jgi:hypothetical protein
MVRATGSTNERTDLRIVVGRTNMDIRAAVSQCHRLPQRIVSIAAVCEHGLRA